MKKIGVGIVLVLFALSFVIPGAVLADDNFDADAAAYRASLAGGGSSTPDNPIEKGFNAVVKFTVGQVKPFAMGTNDVTETEILFIKLLIFILIFAMINTAVKRIPQFETNKPLSAIVSLIVALIGVRFITTKELINFIWLPQGVIAVAISVLIPFIIGFFFIEGFNSSLIRKVGWSTYVVIFMGLAFMRWNDLQVNVSGLPAGAWYSNLGMIYLIIAVLSFLLIVFDRTIHAKYTVSTIMKDADEFGKIQAVKLIRDIKENTELLPHASGKNLDAIKNQIKADKEKLAELIKASSG